MECKKCNIDQPCYSLAGLNGEPLLSICPGCIKEMLTDHYYVVNLVASILPREKRGEFKAFLMRILLHLVNRYYLWRTLRAVKVIKINISKKYLKRADRRRIMKSLYTQFSQSNY
jgi:hypothetical protein